MSKLRIMSVFGTRPEAIKMAPLVKELATRDEIESLCCVTAQHREMLDSVLEVFSLKPDWDLDIMTPRQTLSTITSKCLLGMDDLGARRYFHHLRRCVVCVLSSSACGPCGSRPADL